MALLKSFSEFLLEKSSDTEDGAIFPLKFTSLVTDKEKDVSKESFMKIIDSLDKEKLDEMVSSEYEILYEFAKKIGDRKEEDILKSVGLQKKELPDAKDKNYKGIESYNKSVDSIIEVNKKIKEEFLKYIGEKKIKDFKNEENRNKIREFYNKGIEGLRKSDDKFYDSLKSLYDEDSAKKDKEKEGKNLAISVERIIEIVQPSEEKKLKIESKANPEEAQKKATQLAVGTVEKQVEQGIYDTLKDMLTRIIYCLSSSYGCLTQINRLTIISSSEDRAKKDELMGKYKEDGSIEKQGTVYKGLTELNTKLEEIFKIIKETEEKAAEKEEKTDSEDQKTTPPSIKIEENEFDLDNSNGLKNKIFSLRDKIKELQSISDDSVMTQTDWDEYVKDKGREGFRYQDLKEAFGYLQSAVNNYCTAENGANALELYFQIFEDYIKSLE